MSRQRATREQLYYNPPVFSFPEQKFRHADRNPHYGSRKHHLRRLNDIVHLCLQRGDLVRAKAAFSVLARCREVEWTDTWRTALALVGAGVAVSDGEASSEKIGRHLHGHARLELLKVVVTENKNARVEAMEELLLTYIAMGQYQEARDYLSEDYLSIYPHHDSTILQTYGGLISLYLAYEIGATQSTFSQSLLQTDSLAKNTTAFNKNHLRAAKDHFEQALRLGKDNEVARSFIEKLRPQFKAHEIKISILDSTGESERPDEQDDGVSGGYSNPDGGNRIRDPEKFRKASGDASDIEDQEWEPLWAHSSPGGDDDDDADDASAAHPTFRAMTHGRQNLGENSLSEDMAQLSVNVRRSSSARKKDGKRPESASRQNSPSAPPTESLRAPLPYDSSSVETASPVTTMPSRHARNQAPTFRSLQNSPSVSRNTHIASHNANIPTRRRSFADINRDASPELVDDTVYIDESTDYGYDSPDAPTSPPLGATKQFTGSSIGTSSSLSTESDSGGRVFIEGASDSEMDMDAEWAQ